MKYISIFLVIITDTNTSILNETLRAFTVILENRETPTSSKTYLQKGNKLFKRRSWKHLEKKNHENILDVSKRLDSNYSFGQFYKDMFD